MRWNGGPGHVLVRVPATSANLGPGFDALGLALTLHDEVEAEIIGSGLEIDVAGEGAAEVTGAGDGHLVVRAMRAAFAGLGTGQPPGLALRCVNRIPHGRGLGSSAAAIVAGVLAARALAGAGVAPGDALPLASGLEGHPDNVAPCLYGGLTVAWHSGGAAARAVRLEPAARVRPVAVIAPEPVPTEVARGLLPAVVPHRDAARNAGRAALLIAALTRYPEALLDATQDWLHQGYREPAMPATAELVARLRAAGVPAVVSGAGPSVLAFVDSGDSGSPGPPGVPVPGVPALSVPALAAWRDGLDIVDSTVKETGIDWRISPLDIERQGASVVPGRQAASGEAGR